MSEHPMLRTYSLPPVSEVSLAVRALHDIWAFCDLINYHGGSSTFYQLHRDMAEVQVRPNCLNRPDAEPSLESRRRIFLVPRDHRKSSVLSVLYVLWRIYRNPNIRILLACNVKELSMGFIGEVRTYLEDPELQQTVWNNRPHISGRLIPLLRSASSNYKVSLDGEWDYDFDEYGTVVPSEEPLNNRKRVWTNYKLQVVRTSGVVYKEPTINAISVGMRVTGQHYDLLIADDIVDLVNSNTPDKAKSISKWADDLANVLSKKSRWEQFSANYGEWVGNERVVIGTRYYSWDYYGTIIDPPNYEFHEDGVQLGDELNRYVNACAEYARDIRKYTLFFRTLYCDNTSLANGYICPEIVSEEEDKLLQADIDDIDTYFAQYFNICVNTGTSSLPLYRSVPCNAYTSIGHGLVAYQEFREIDSRGAPTVYNIQPMLMVDLAVSQRKTADNSAVAIGGYDTRGTFHLIDGFTGRVLPAKLYEKCWELLDKWALSSLNYEGGVGYQGAFGHSFRDTFVNHRPVTLFEHTPANDVAKHVLIVNTLQPLLSNGMFCVASNVVQYTSLQQELASFGKVTGKNDMLDVCQKLARMALKHRADPSRGKVVNMMRFNSRYGGVG